LPIGESGKASSTSMRGGGVSHADPGHHDFAILER